MSARTGKAAATWSQGLLTRLRDRTRSDAGLALLSVIIFVLVASALGGIAVAAAINGQKQARGDLASAGSQATSDAGVAEALGYVQNNSLAGLTCTEPLTSDTPSVNCSSNIAWANNVHPETVVVGSSSHPASCAGITQDCYEVWIGTLQPYSPGGGPGQVPQPALLRIHSTGFTGSGPSARSLDVDVSVVPDHYPIGLFGNAVNTNGSYSTSGESVFAAGNIRMKCPPTGWDYEYHIPASVHAGGVITYEHDGSCDSGGSGQVHASSVCNTRHPFDQDSMGGPLTSGDGCYEQGPVYAANNGISDPSMNQTYPTTSYFTAGDLAAYGYQPDGLTSSEYSALKSEAQAEGTYFTTNTSAASALSALASANVADAVVYYDFPTSGTAPKVDLSQAIPSYYTRSYPQS
ncbi:MAG: hypothetical protein ACYDB7_14025, partial [Mycobacteriales bacterium]